jgi:hypothetical protein
MHRHEQRCDTNHSVQAPFFAAFTKIWSMFQTKAASHLDKAVGGRNVGYILWTSELTRGDNIDKLSPDKYTIQGRNKPMI